MVNAQTMKNLPPNVRQKLEEAKEIMDPRLLLIFYVVPSFSAISAQNSSPCQPPEIEVPVYNFVPEARLQTDDFRSLMKSESNVDRPAESVLALEAQQISNAVQK